MKIERETVEHLDRLLCATPSMGGYFEVPEDMRPVIEELTRTWLALDAAPVFDIHLVHDSSGRCIAANFATRSDPGQRVSLVATSWGE